MSMLLKIHPETPSSRQINAAIDVLQNEGVIIYPTDSIYGLGCSIYSKRAVERVAQIKGINLKKANFSFLFKDLAQVAEYVKPIDNNIFKVLKKNIPGPFTFILNANKKVPAIFENSKKTIGVRIPNNKIIHELVKGLGNPIMTTSVHDDDEIIEYTTDPELIWERYKNIVDAVIDGGYGNNVATTVVDCTGDEPVIIRQGIGELRF